MKVKAIVYKSNSGHTRDYAKLLSAQTGLPCYTPQEAKENLENNADVIYLGWLMAGRIKGYAKINKIYSVKLVCAVGMTPPSETEKARLAKQNNISADKLILLLGGYDGKKLKGVYKFMMNVMSKIIVKQLSKKINKTPDDLLLIDMAIHGGYFVSVENLKPVVDKLTD